jgi:hypothetical protein
MTTERENERAATEVTTPPVVPVERASAVPSTYTNGKHPISMGATPYTPVVTDLLAALREAEGYVVAEVVGDVDGQPEVAA